MKRIILASLAIMISTTTLAGHDAQGPLIMGTERSGPPDIFICDTTEGVYLLSFLREMVIKFPQLRRTALVLAQSKCHRPAVVTFIPNRVLCTFTSAATETKIVDGVEVSTGKDIEVIAYIVEITVNGEQKYISTIIPVTETVEKCDFEKYRDMMIKDLR